MCSPWGTVPADRGRSLRTPAQVVSTERPDRAVSFLLEGQAVILIDGSPRCLAMPVSFWHLFHAPDDSYMRWMYGTFMRVVRAVGAVLALLLPAVFVSMVIFHPLALPMSLLTTSSRAAPSYPSASLAKPCSCSRCLTSSMRRVRAFRSDGVLFRAGERADSGNRRCGRRTGESAVDHRGGAFRPGQLCAAQLLAELCVSHGQMALLIAGGLMGLPGVCLLLLLMVMRVAGMEAWDARILRPPVRTVCTTRI